MLLAFKSLLFIFVKKLRAKDDKTRYSRILGIDVQTLRNWRKTRPNLYKTIMLELEVEFQFWNSYFTI